MTTFENVIELLAIEEIVNKLSDMEKNDMMSKLRQLKNVYPFSDYEFVISNLLGLDKMTLQEYETMRSEYMDRNYYLHTFQMAGKSVGTWAEQLLISGGHGLKKPSKKIDPHYSQQTSYDAYLEYNGGIIRVEIKASRVTESGNDEDIFIDKALFSDTKKSFWMNFQQLKPQYCDVFIFVAIYRDKLKYWILSSKDVRNYGSNTTDIGRFSPGQHSGNAGNEGQLHIREYNIVDFDPYLTEPENVKTAIIEAYKKQIQ
ncbi:MAG: hypothetical protein PHR61_02130 [Candidatus Absconditabacteria bacterium]|nr:hypothetical protein [Candidatus Absconditabacteria bacterium]